jgi:putative glycosyltransferase (TIGR04348 family)
MLRDRCKIIVQTEWAGEPVDALIALHARRSAGSVEAFHATGAGRCMAVVLTGTDLYKDLPASPEASRSLDLAGQIVVLQEDAPHLLEARWRRKTRVIFQSAPSLAPRRKPAGRLDCVVVGHLREEKDPRTLFAAVSALPRDLPISIRHIGEALDAGLGAEALALQEREPRYRYSGALSLGLARSAMKSAHLLIHPSIVEGGANVIVESVTAGTPVVASRISGNVGMLGRGYGGYFEPRDSSGLAARLVQALEEREYLRRLSRECALRRKLFTPEAEARAVRRLAEDLMA